MTWLVFVGRLDRSAGVETAGSCNCARSVSAVVVGGGGGVVVVVCE